MIYLNPKTQIDEAVQFIRQAFELKSSDNTLRTGIILGSGQAGFVDHITELHSVDFADIPHCPQTSGPLHPGKLVLAEISDKNAKNLCKVIISVGRLHPYDGLTAQQVVFPLELMAHLGIKNVILCNASGAINPDYEVGELYLIKDHINFTGLNPLLSVFPSMERAYSPQLIELINGTAESIGQDQLELATYIGVLGPNFETPAEITAFRSWGADLVGMSTVLEVIAAAALQLSCAGIALCSNMAAGVTNKAVLVDDIVLNTGESVEKLYKLLLSTIALL